MNESSTAFIIAEAGVNHNGDAELAVELLDAAIDSGADAVKFQTFSAEAMVTRAAEKAAYQKLATGDSSQWEMLKTLELPHVLHFQLKEICEQAGVEFMSTAFDSASLRFLVHELGLKRLKIPSGEVTNGPFLLEHARCGLPMILSTGMASLDEVRIALGVLAFGMLEEHATPSLAAFEEAFASSEGQALLRQRVAVLHCTTEYPAPFEDINLRAMDTLRESFGLETGYSDHSLGIGVSIAAAARGATLIEKHITLDASLPGPDHACSLEPGPFLHMVEAIRAVEQALGSPVKAPMPSELPNIEIARRSLVAIRPIARGEQFDATNLSAKRPAGGRSPMDFWQLVGTAATRDFDADELID